MKGVNISLFEFDRHNALYYFVLNAEENIYLRYGGRDAESPTKYLNMESLELALSQGLEQHKLYQEGKLVFGARPSPLYPRDIKLLDEKIIKKNHCVECHQIADYQTLKKEKSGTLDKLHDMFLSPDIKALGIELDVPRGLVVASAGGAASASGMLAGDVISEINSKSILTFGDLQYQLNKVPRDAQFISMAVARGKEKKELRIQLPDQWWVTDLGYRYLSVDPLVFFEAVPLKLEEKKKLDLLPSGFASRVSKTDLDAVLGSAHELKEGDVIISVNGNQKDPITKNVITHIKLRHKAGDALKLEILRGQKRMELPLKTKRQEFRRRE